MKYRFKPDFNPVYNNCKDIPWRYHKRIFTLVNIVGEYGIFTNPDRKKPFVIHMQNLEMCK